ncbi:MAG: hypothetical protein RLZZ397_220 [Pseudomonadota bacterium]
MNQPISTIKPEGIRLNKRMAELGLCSRREADDWIQKGWVRVNGQVAQLGVPVQPNDRITVDKAATTAQQQQVTIMLHKPVGYVSGQAEDGHQPAIVLIRPENRWRGDRSKQRFQPSQRQGLAVAGRLDIDSTGLLLLTQDGRVAKHVIGENSEVEKEYLVRVVPAQGAQANVTAQEWLPAQQLARLRYGLSLDGQALRPARVEWLNPDQLKFVLREGKKRQIRRMCELVGLKVTGLKRVRIGKTRLGELPMGQWRYLDPHELP